MTPALPISEPSSTVTVTVDPCCIRDTRGGVASIFSSADALGRLWPAESPQDHHLVDARLQAAGVDLIAALMQPMSPNDTVDAHRVADGAETVV